MSKVNEEKRFQNLNVKLFNSFKIIIKFILLCTFVKKSSAGEWLSRSLADMGVHGSSLLTASQRCDSLKMIKLQLECRFD